MSLTATVYLSVAFVFFLCYYYFFKNNGNFPPGPKGVPILGYLPFLRRDTFRQFAEMSKTYGKVLQVQIGLSPVVVLNSWASVKEALLGQNENFSGRPNVYVFKAATKFKDIVTQDNNPMWKEQRRFMQNRVKNYTMGPISAEKAVEEEAEKLVNKLEESSGKLIQPNDLFFVPLINVTWYIYAGEKFAYGSSKIDKFIEMLQFNFVQFDPANIVNFFPIYRFFGNSFTKFVKNNDNIDNFLLKSIKEHKSAFVEGTESRDYIDAFLEQMQKHKDEAEQENPYSEARLIGSLYSAFNAGTETSSTTLAWGILYVTLWPEIQDKIHKEIDATLGRSKMPSYSDRDMLPYTLATILEIQRRSTIVPLAIPHKTKCATKVCGFDIPAKTTVWPNLWAIHHDPELWGDPEVFRPERFINSEGKVKKPEYLIPFSVGYRACVGERLAKLELFVFFASVMQHFRFRFPSGIVPPSIEPIVGVTLRPHPYSLIIESRI